MPTRDFIQWFRSASPYINAHRGKTFVLMLPGACLEQETFHWLINDIALLDSLGIRLVLVHGARPQIDSQLQAQGMESRFYRGLRVSEAEQMVTVTQVVAGLRARIEAALSAGLPNSPMQGARIRTLSGNFITAMPRGVIDGVDLQHTGKVRKVNGPALEAALEQGAVVAVPNLGYSLTGETFNLSYDEVATHIAETLGADKLIAFADVAGLTTKDGELQRELSLAECPDVTEGSSLLGTSLAACRRACEAGVPRAHIVSYRDDGALLLELFTRDGAGTMLHSDNYESLRQANIEDVGGVLELLEPLEQHGVLVRRSRELLETEIDQFHVIEKDGSIIACAALYPMDETVAELACVATHSDYRNRGRGTLLLESIERMARGRGIETLCVLTTQTAHWFLEHGFQPDELESLPPARQRLYNYQRNSKIFLKDLRTG